MKVHLRNILQQQLHYKLNNVLFKNNEILKFLIQTVFNWIQPIVTFFFCQNLQLWYLAAINLMMVYVRNILQQQSH